MSQISQLVATITFAMVALLPVTGMASQADPAQTTYPGLLGDNINFRTGELTINHTDVSVSGRRGLDVAITRHYSSNCYETATVDSASSYRVYDNVADPSLYRYLGTGWHIEFPFLTDDGDRDQIVYQDGSKEAYFANPDTLTNEKYTWKTRNLSLLTDFGIANDTVADTLLLGDGGKWVFGKVTTHRKHLTKVFNKFRDSVTVEYYSSTDIAWAKKVTSPSGRHVTFQYRNSTGPIDTATAPSGDTIRLYRLWYLNHKDSALCVEYQYDSLGYLDTVILPNGQFEEYEYTNSVNHYPMVDWDSDDNSSLYDNPDSVFTGDLYYLSRITGPAGGQVDFRYKSINIPLYTPCDGNVHNWEGNGDSLNIKWDFRNYVAVNRRISEGDTLKLAFQMVKKTLNDFTAVGGGIPASIGSKTSVQYPGGFSEELFFHFEAGCEPGYKSVPISNYFGSWPGYLFERQSINDADTSCTVFTYNYDDTYYSWWRHDTLGYYADTTIDTTVEWGDTTIDTTVVTTFISRVNYTVARGGGSFLDLYLTGGQSDCAQLDTRFWVPVSGKRKEVNVSHLAYSGRYLQTASLHGIDSMRTCYYSDPGMAEGSPFSRDSALIWGYVPDLNLSIIYKRMSIVFSGGDTSKVYDSIVYDTVHYHQIARELRWFDTAYHAETDTCITEYRYDSLSLLECKKFGIKSGSSIIASDSVKYEYNSDYRLKKIIDQDFAGGSRDLKTIDYFDNSQLKKETDMYGESVQYRYDRLGRDSAVWLPLIEDTTEASALTLRVTDSAWTGESVKIDSSHTSFAKSYYNAFYRTVKNMTQVSSSPDDFIVDSIVYSSLGLIDSTMRPRYRSDTTSSRVWTKFKYDQAGRLVKIIYPDSTCDSVHFVNDSTIEYLYARGNKKTNVLNFEGDLIESRVYDTSGTYVGSYLYEYGAMGRLAKTTDLEGRSREYEYNDYGLQTKLTDPDVGVVQTWYNKRGQKRFVRYNSESAYTYFKYDTDQRMYEFGTVDNPCLDSIEITWYPLNNITKTATFRYDTYSDSVAYCDTAGGLWYCLGRLTEARAWSGNDTLSVDRYYYDAKGQIGLKSMYIKEYWTNKLKYQYYDNGELKRISYPNNHDATYDLDMAGRVTEIDHTRACASGTTMQPIVENIVYDAWGPATAWDFENGLKSRRRYDNMGRLEGTQNYTLNQNLYSRKFDYTNGFITSETTMDTTGGNSVLPGVIREYNYDARGRLDTATLVDPFGTANVDKIGFAYDDNGNLDVQDFTMTIADVEYHRFANSNCDSAIVCAGPSSSWFFVRDARGRIIRKTSYDDSSPSDSTLWQTRESYTYDHRNLLTHVRDTLRYALWNPSTGWTQHLADLYYNSDGQRVKAVVTEKHWVFEPIDSIWYVGSNTITRKYYLWSGDKIVYEKIGNNEARNHVYGLGQKLASAYRDARGGWGGGMMMMGMEPPPDTSSTYPDPGDPPGEDTCYTRLTYYVNDQYGSVRAGMSGATVLTKLEYYPYGEVYSMSGGGSVYTFLGKEDPGVGILDFGPRYYNSFLGRFLSPDPILASPSAYSYTHGNPIMLYDPSGMLETEYYDPWESTTPFHEHTPPSEEWASETWDYQDDLRQQQDDQEDREEQEIAAGWGGEGWGKDFGPGWDPANPAGKGWKWVGKDGSKPGSPDGMFHNPETDEWIRPDLGENGHGPHWDYWKNNRAPKQRIDPDTGKNVDKPSKQREKKPPESAPPKPEPRTGTSSNMQLDKYARGALIVIGIIIIVLEPYSSPVVLPALFRR